MNGRLRQVQNGMLGGFFAALLGVSGSTWAQDNPSKPEPADPLMSMSLQDLLDVDVAIASRQTESIVTSPSVVTSISMADMMAVGAVTLKDALELVPNVVLAETSVGSTSVSIRGLHETFNQKVLFLLEGVPYWMSSHGDIPLLGIPVEMISRIEIIRGPGSVLYGTNASGGVINVILKKDVNHSSANAMVGSQGLFQLGGHTANDGVYFGGSLQRMAQGYKAFFPQTQLVPPFVTGTRADGSSFPSSGSLQKREEFSNFVAGLNKGNFNLLVHAFESTQNGLGGAPVIFQPNELTYRGALVHAGYTHKVGGWSFSAGADHNIFFLDLELQNFLATLNPLTGVVTSQPGRQQYRNPWGENFRTRASLLANYSFSDRLSLLLGVEDELRSAGRYVKTDTLDTVLALQSRATRVNEFSGLAQVDWSFWKLRTVVGGRFVNNQLAGSHFAPRASLIYEFAENQSLKLLYSEGFNSPVISQQDLLIPFVVEGSKGLKAEILRTVDVAYTLARPNLLLVVNAYYLVTDRVISRFKPAGALQPAYVNSAGYSRAGLEADFQYSFRGLKLLANASYNHQGNRVYLTDPFAQVVPRLQASAGLRYSLGKYHTLGISQRFLSARSGVGPQAITNAMYTFRYDPVQLYVTASNLFNRRIDDPDINSRQIPSIPGGPGRSFYAGVRYDF